jgi:hypothetical protein
MVPQRTYTAEGCPGNTAITPRSEASNYFAIMAQRGLYPGGRAE